MSLRAPTASRGGPGALSLDVALLAAVATSDVRPYLLVGLGFVSMALKPKSALTEAVCVLVCYCQNHRRRLDGSFAVASLDAWRPTQPLFVPRTNKNEITICIQFFVTRATICLTMPISIWVEFKVGKAVEGAV